MCLSNTILSDSSRNAKANRIMLCPQCSCQSRRFGKDRNGNQRYQCKPCKQTFTDIPAKPLGSMRLPMEKAVLVLKLLLEGCSVRATVRLSGISCDTVLALLVHAGEKAKDLMESRIVNVKVLDNDRRIVQWTECNY